MTDIELDTLINRYNRLSENYVPSDLIITDDNTNNFHNYINPKNKPMISKRVISDFNDLQENAKKMRYEIIIDSGYRSYKYQNAIWLYNLINNIKELKRIYPNMDYQKIYLLAYDKTCSLVAFPGCSEHQSGLAFDMACKRNGIYYDNNLGDTEEALWMSENAYKYGFILRYPNLKKELTGYAYEPWHYRYVGRILSEELYNNGEWITLEEYHEHKLVK